MKPILLVDDDIIFLDLLAASLKRKGFAVIKASSVAEAKNILKEHTPLLICSDLVMPKESGFDLLDFIHNRFPNIPFIVMSAHDKEFFSDEAIRLGAVYAISKCQTRLLEENIIKFANQSLPINERIVPHRLLYLHKDKTSGEVLRAALLQRQYHVTLSMNIADALSELIESSEIKLILCDSSFDEGSALDLLKELRENTLLHLLRADIPPCIVILQKCDSIQEGAYLQEGAYDCIPEPIYFPTLLASLENYFELLQK